MVLAGRTGDEHVRRLDVAVHEPLDMRRVQRRSDLRHELGGQALVEMAALRDQLGHVDALDVAHDDVQLPVVGLAGAIERDHVRVLDLRRDLGLAAEALAEVAIAGQFRGDHLDRHRALEPHVGGAVDDAHAAAAGGVVDAVVADDRADLQAGHQAARRTINRRGAVGRGLPVCLPALTYWNGTCTVPSVPSLAT